MLLQEQEEWNIAKQCGDVTLLPYLRANIQEISGNDAPTPDTDVWIRYIYTKALEGEVENIRKLIFTTVSKRPINIVSGSADSSESASSSDIESYCPNKSSRFNIAIKMGGKKKRRQKRKRKRKKRKKGRSKKRRKRSKRRETSSSGSSSSSSSSDSSADEVQPNGRRVSARAYGPNHYEQLQEFMDDYATHCKDGHQGNWPEDEALAFIGKKFARAGSDFGSKGNKGVKRCFKLPSEKSHAKARTATIYDMSNEVASLRLERHQMIAREARRIKGAKSAKAARMKKNLRKRMEASLVQEQALVARVGVLCDLVLMGKAAWNSYHRELELGGQKEAIVESMGGGIPKTVAAKAWKAASASALKPWRHKPQPTAIREESSAGAGVGKQRVSVTGKPYPPCYYCTKNGHAGRNCPDKKAGIPYKPNSRKAVWVKEETEKKRKVKSQA